MTDVPAEESDVEPFDLLANGIRLDIIRSLGEGMAGGEHTPLSFSDLQRAVGVEDNGKFTYHLQKLTGHFVEKVDGGYRLKPSGISVFQAVKSGTYHSGPTVAPTDKGDPCITCDNTTSIWYEAGRVYAGCEHCDDVTLAYPLPPGTFDADDPGSLADAASSRLSRDQRSFLRGVCPYCSGPVDCELLTEPPEWFEDEWDAFAACHCERCYWFMKFSLESAYREHPSVVSFFYERDLNLQEVRQWNTPFEYDVTVRQENPLEVALTYHWDGDARTLLVDDELNVVAVEDD